MSVPSQLSVVGFNDLPAAAASEPPLTTVRQPLVEKGEQAARLLMSSAQAGEPGVVRLEAKLMVRGTTAAAPALNVLRSANLSLAHKVTRRRAPLDPVGAVGAAR